MFNLPLFFKILVSTRRFFRKNVRSPQGAQLHDDFNGQVWYLQRFPRLSSKPCRQAIDWIQTKLVAGPRPYVKANLGCFNDPDAALHGAALG
jgi:hypothetical protein